MGTALISHKVIEDKRRRQGNPESKVLETQQLVIGSERKYNCSNFSVM